MAVLHRVWSPKLKNWGTWELAELCPYSRMKLGHESWGLPYSVSEAYFGVRYSKNDISRFSSHISQVLNLYESYKSSGRLPLWCSYWYCGFPFLLSFARDGACALMHLDEKDTSVVKRSRTMGRRPEVEASCLAWICAILICGLSVIVAEPGESEKYYSNFLCVVDR